MESTGADLILADLGVSSMQIDDPARGFSVKLDGPLDMRMNPQRGQPASALLQKIQPAALAEMLEDNSDEPQRGATRPLPSREKIFRPRTTGRRHARRAAACWPRMISI